MTSPHDPGRSRPDHSEPAKPPSLVPGVVLLVLAGVLIVITLIKPDLPRWLTVTDRGRGDRRGRRCC